MWQTRYDAILAALSLVFGLAKIDCCDFNFSNFFFLNSLWTGKSFVLIVVRQTLIHA